MIYFIDLSVSNLKKSKAYKKFLKSKSRDTFMNNTNEKDETNYQQSE